MTDQEFRGRGNRSGGDDACRPWMGRTNGDEYGRVADRGRCPDKEPQTMSGTADDPRWDRIRQLEHHVALSLEKPSPDLDGLLADMREYSKLVHDFVLSSLRKGHEDDEHERP